jgi:hypothetical protein
MSEEVFLDLIKEKIKSYVLLMLADYICLCYYKFWSLEIQRNTWNFCIGYEFLGDNWVPNTYYNWFVWNIWNIRSNIGKKCTRSYKVVWITKNILVYVKDEGSYLNTMTTIYKSIVNCETLSMVENVKGTCFVHALLKACQYVTPKEKVCRGFKYISIKFFQKHL